MWRWESYGGVEVQVPADWGHGTTRWPPCLQGQRGPGRPYVGRPGAVPAVGCPPGMLVPPLDKRVAYLWFHSGIEPGVRTHDGGWADETRVVAGVTLTVLSDDAVLRGRILDSARPATGAAAEHAITSGPDARPDPGPGGLATVGTPESITLCRYAIGSRPKPAESPVLSVSELTGEPARAVVHAILAAPEGHGPDDPDDCIPEVAHGDEVLLLTVRGSARTQEVFVRYSGCVGHGFDDGHTHRRLTADALKPLLSGPHHPTSLHRSVAELVWLG